LVGFENHQGCTSLGPGATPLGRVVTGTGNGDGTRTEGAMQGSIIATSLHGPALALNPALADLLLARVIGNLDPIEDELTTRARASRLNPV
ncbi:MAG: glutamine amidotransferase, partial [Actinomycetota bacterium]